MKETYKRIRCQQTASKRITRVNFQTKVNDTKRKLGTSGVKEENRNNIWQM